MVFAGGGGLVESAYDKKTFQTNKHFQEKRWGKIAKNGEVVSVCPRLLCTFLWRI